MSNQEDELKLTLQLLSESFTCKDNIKQKEIATKLKELSQDYYHHIQILIKGITLDSDQISLDLKKSIGIYLKTLIHSHRGQLSEKELLEVLQFFIQAIILSQIPPAIFPFFQSAIGDIISDEVLTKNYEYLKGVFNYLATELAQCAKEQFIKQATGVINLISVFVQSRSIGPSGIATISNTMFGIIDGIFALVPSYINQTNGVNTEFIGLLKIIYDFFILLVNKLKKIENEPIQISFLFEKYGIYTCELMNLSIGNTEPNTIIYMNNNQEFDTQINIMKGKTIQFISTLINAGGNPMTDNNLIISSSNMIKVIIDSLDSLIKTNFPKIQSLAGTDLKEGLHSIVYSMITFLSRALIRDPIKEQFTPLVNNFILNILFPLLLSTPNDIAEIKDSGEEYFRFLTDLIEAHEIKTYRTAAAALFQKICDQYPFVNSLFTSFILKYLESLLNEEKKEENMNHLLLTLNPSSLLITMNVENKIDFCFLILALLHDNLFRNISYIQTLRTILITYSNKLFNINSILVIDKLCLFFSYYIQYLFQDTNDNNYEYYTIVFNFLMRILLNYKQYEGLGFQSANAIREMLYDSNVKNSFIFSDIINQNMPEINMLIEESEVDLLFDVLIYITDKIDFNSEDVQYDFLTKIVRRMKKEILDQKIQNAMSDFLEKSFAILNKYLKRKNLTNEPTLKVTIDSFEALVQPIVLYMKNPSKICFEDSIISLMKNEIISAQMITPLPLSILPMLELSCKKNKMLSEDEYSFLCVFLKYDVKLEYTSLLINEIINLIYLGYQLDKYEGGCYSLLLTIDLLSKNHSLEKAALFSLLAKSYENVTQLELPKSPQDIIDESFEFTIFAGIAVICSSMITKPVETLEYLQTSNYFSSFLNYVKVVIKCQFHSIKLMKQIILGLCSIIHNQETQQKLANLDQINQIFIYIFNLTYKQKNRETNSLKRLMKKELNCNFVKSEDNDYNNYFDLDLVLDDDDDEGSNGHYGNGYYEGQNYTELIKEINLSQNEVDEYCTFTQCLKEINPSYLNAFEQSLSDSEKKILTELSHIKKVDIYYNNKKMPVPRRTVVIKRHGDPGNNSSAPSLINENNNETK